MVRTSQEKYFFYLLLLVSLVLSFFIFRPFLVVIILAASFAVIIHPLYDWLLRKVTKMKALASFLAVTAFVFVVGGPLVGLGALVYQESHSLFMTSEGPFAGPVVDTVAGIAETILPKNLNLNVEEMARNFVGSISNNLAHIFASTLSTILSISLMIFSMFFFLKDGETWRNFLVKVSPLPKKYDEAILEELKMTINGVIKGYLLIALIQGILMGLGLAVFHVPNAALWGLVAGIAALIPTVGTAIVSVPIIIYLYASGDTTSAFGFLVWATIIVGLVDNFLNPIIVGRKVNIHPLVILFAVLGGIGLFGPAGILMGPLVVSLLFVLGNMYIRNFEKPMPSKKRGV